MLRIHDHDLFTEVHAMNKLSWVGFFICALTALPAAPVSAAGLTTISGAQLEAMQADGKPIVIVDVREPELFVKGHIKGAINIPYDDARPRIVKELSPTDRIVFVCHGGPMGDKLGHLLIRKGYRTVYNLEGGMKKWTGPLVR
jgi:rhodanese-related sulfurtransferase